jgi:hypothetical protein
MTTNLFHCSACGAPLTPKGSTSVISCPYCHASVVVPEDLRQVSDVAAWSVQLFDGFTENENSWLVGDQQSKYFTKLSRVITDGRYRWEAQTSTATGMASAWLSDYPVSDFHLDVTCKHIRGSKAGSSWGVVFRVQDNDNHYWFRITDNQFFAVSLMKDSQWLNIVEWTKTDAIKPHGVNQIDVIGHGTHFTFLINEQVVTEINDERFQQGSVGVGIETYTLGEEITFDFLELRLRAPKGF